MPMSITFTLDDQEKAKLLTLVAPLLETIVAEKVTAALGNIGSLVNESVQSATDSAKKEIVSTLSVALASKLAGDANNDGKVDAADLGILLSNFGKTSTG